MRILIQQSCGEGYFDGVHWTDDMEQAKDFGSVPKAEAFCSSRNLTDALIVVKFKNSAPDIRYFTSSKVLLDSKSHPVEANNLL